MNVDKGRKLQVQVMFTAALLAQVDAIAEREAGGDEPNRSKVIRRLVAEGVERERATRLHESPRQPA